MDIFSLQRAETKLGIFSYDNKRFNYKTILIYFKKQQNKKIVTKQ